MRCLGTKPDVGDKVDMGGTTKTLPLPDIVYHLEIPGVDLAFRYPVEIFLPVIPEQPTSLYGPQKRILDRCVPGIYIFIKSQKITINRRLGVFLTVL